MSFHDTKHGGGHAREVKGWEGFKGYMWAPTLTPWRERQQEIRKEHPSNTSEAEKASGAKQ